MRRRGGFVVEGRLPARLDMLLGTYRATERTALITGTSFYLFPCGGGGVSVVGGFCGRRGSRRAADGADALHESLRLDERAHARPSSFLTRTCSPSSSSVIFCSTTRTRGVSRHVAARSSDAAKSRSGDLVFSMRDLTFSLRRRSPDVARRRLGHPGGRGGRPGGGRKRIGQDHAGQGSSWACSNPTGAFCCFEARRFPLTPDELSASIGAFFQDFLSVPSYAGGKRRVRGCGEHGDEDAVRRALSLGGGGRT